MRVALPLVLAAAVGCGGGGDKPAPAPPEHVEPLGFAQGLKAHFSSKRTAPEFTNLTPTDLTDVELTITFTPRDPAGSERVERVRWDVWRKGEKRTPDVTVERNTYTKVRAVGTAKRDGKPVPLKFGVDVL